MAGRRTNGEGFHLSTELGRPVAWLDCREDELGQPKCRTVSAKTKIDALFDAKQEAGLAPSTRLLIRSVAGTGHQPSNQAAHSRSNRSGDVDPSVRAGHREFRAALRVMCDGRLRHIEETGFSRIARRG